MTESTVDVNVLKAKLTANIHLDIVNAALNVARRTRTLADLRLKIGDDSGKEFSEQVELAAHIPIHDMDRDPLSGPIGNALYDSIKQTVQAQAQTLEFDHMITEVVPVTQRLNSDTVSQTFTNFLSVKLNMRFNARNGKDE